MANAGRLARNTVYMYIRMVILMLIGFYTSRVLLRELGVEDFGIYGLIGSIIAMFGSLRGLFVTSTQRFLNFEMGRGDKERLKKVFNTSIIVNLCIAIMFTMAVEAVGLFFISHGINVPREKFATVPWILHLSVVTSVVYIMTTPYDALIIAHERISAYAWLTIIDHLLKLFIIYLLYLQENRLVFYTVLLFVVSLIMAAVYMVYCRLYFEECRYTLRTDRECLKQMSSFAGWQFFGNTAFALTHNGLNMVLNTFGGVMVNAARTIAYQANAAINQLVVNMSLVLSPYSVKSYATGEREKMYQLFFISSRAMFVIAVIAMLPILFFTEPVLRLWLGSVPAFSVVFLKLILLWSVLRALHSPFDTLFKSVGKIKYYQLSEGIILSLPVLFSYIAMKIGASIYIVFVFVVLFEMINLVNLLLLARKVCGLDIEKYLRHVIGPGLLVSVILVLCYLVQQYYMMHAIDFIMVLVAEASVLMSYLRSASKEEKIMINKILIKVKIL